MVLASGTGTLLQALLDSEVSRHIVAVGSDVSDAPALQRATESGKQTFVVPMEPTRRDWDQAMLGALASVSPDIVVTAGFMRVLGPNVVSNYANRIVNSHPALLPAFPGAHAVRDAIKDGVKVTGCTVHLVDEGVDTGPIIAQQPVAVADDDTVDSLHERIKEIERVLLVDVVDRMVREGITVRGRSVTFG